MDSQFIVSRIRYLINESIISPGSVNIKEAELVKVDDYLVISGKLNPEIEKNCSTLEGVVTVCVENANYKLSLPKDPAKVNNSGLKELIISCDSLPGDRIDIPLDAQFIVPSIRHLINESITSPGNVDIKEAELVKVDDYLIISGKLNPEIEKNCNTLEGVVTVCVENANYKLSLPKDPAKVNNRDIKELIVSCDSLPGDSIDIPLDASSLEEVVKDG